MIEPAISDSTALTGWRKSSYSSSETDSCVEIIDNHPTAIPVRDSKTPHGPALLFPPAGWTAFVAALRDGVLRG